MTHIKGAKSVVKHPEREQRDRRRTNSTPAARSQRERVLSNTPSNNLVQMLIAEEQDAKEARRLLRSAVAQLESAAARAATAERRGKALEEEQRVQGAKLTQALVDAQKEAMKAREDVSVYKLQLQNAEREM